MTDTAFHCLLLKSQINTLSHIMLTLSIDFYTFRLHKCQLSCMSMFLFYINLCILGMAVSIIVNSTYLKVSVILCDMWNNMVKMRTGNWIAKTGALYTKQLNIPYREEKKLQVFSFIHFIDYS